MLPEAIGIEELKVRLGAGGQIVQAFETVMATMPRHAEILEP